MVIHGQNHHFGIIVYQVHNHSSYFVRVLKYYHGLVPHYLTVCVTYILAVISPPDSRVYFSVKIHIWLSFAEDWILAIWRFLRDIGNIDRLIICLFGLKTIQLVIRSVLTQPWTMTMRVNILYFLIKQPQWKKISASEGIIIPNCL